MVLDSMGTYAKKKEKRRIYKQNKCFVKVYIQKSILQRYHASSNMHAKNP